MRALLLAREELSFGDQRRSPRMPAETWPAERAQPENAALKSNFFLGFTEIEAAAPETFRFLINCFPSRSPAFGSDQRDE